MTDPRPVVCAVVAAFNPEPGLLDTARGVLRQVDALVVVDDGSTSGAQVFAELQHAGAVVLSQPNSGIAGALNAGIEQGHRQSQPDLILTLDQDSRPAEDYVERAVSAWREAGRRGVAVAFVSAESYSGRPAPTDGSVAGLARAFDPMQSGWLVPRSTFEVVGPLAADLVIDGVDSEFTARCRSHDLVPVIGPGCSLEHGQGERLPAVLFGRRVRVGGVDVSYNRHSAVRVFYLTRNGTLITRRHLRHQPRWVLRRLVQETTAHLLRLTFSPDRGLLLRAMAAGWREGCAGRAGRIDPELERRLVR